MACLDVKQEKMQSYKTMSHGLSGISNVVRWIIQC